MIRLGNGLELEMQRVSLAEPQPNAHFRLRRLARRGPCTPIMAERGNLLGNLGKGLGTGRAALDHLA